MSAEDLEPGPGLRPVGEDHGVGVGTGPSTVRREYARYAAPFLSCLHSTDHFPSLLPVTAHNFESSSE